MRSVQRVMLKYGPWIGLLLLSSSLLRTQKTSEASMHSVRHDLDLWQRDLQRIQRDLVQPRRPSSERSWSPRTEHVSYDTPWWRPAT
jgi:hypothetical protein